MRLSTKRQLGPDIVRGALLSLVIFGHTFQQSVDHSHLKWMIYAFHMPLFFALTGSLINLEKLRSRSLPELLTYYAKRMGWQWLVATILFALFRGVSYQNPQELLEDFVLDPYFHLWFVPALFLTVLLTWILVRLGTNSIALVCIGLVTFVLFDALQIQDSMSWLNGDSIDYRFAALYIWFVLGILLAQHQPINPWITLTLTLIGSAGMFVAFPTGGTLRDVSFFLMNVGLASSLRHLIYMAEIVRGLHWLAPIGQFSLWIYLLHPFATDFLRKSPSQIPLWWGFSMSVAVLGMCSFLIKFGRFVRKSV